MQNSIRSTYFATLATMKVVVAMANLRAGEKMLFSGTDFLGASGPSTFVNSTSCCPSSPLWPEVRGSFEPLHAWAVWNLDFHMWSN